MRIDITSFWLCKFPVMLFLHYPHISGTMYQRADVNHEMTSGLTFSSHDTKWISKGELGVLLKAILTLGCLAITFVHTEVCHFFASLFHNDPLLSVLWKLIKTLYIWFFASCHNVSFVSRGYKWDMKREGCEFPDFSTTLLLSPVPSLLQD